MFGTLTIACRNYVDHFNVLIDHFMTYEREREREREITKHNHNMYDTFLFYFMRNMVYIIEIEVQQGHGKATTLETIQVDEVSHHRRRNPFPYLASLITSTKMNKFMCNLVIVPFQVFDLPAIEEIYNKISLDKMANFPIDFL